MTTSSARVGAVMLCVKCSEIFKFSLLSYDDDIDHVNDVVRSSESCEYVLH